MRMICLYPTYGRPQQLLDESIRCFLAHDYPRELRRLLILEDAGLVKPQSGDGWQLWSTLARFPTLPAKHKELLRLAGDGWDAAVVWDDDDVYLPHHLSSNAKTLESRAWRHPRNVWSTYTWTPQLESAAGRFHGSLAIHRDFLEQIRRLDSTPRGDFDQQQIAACQRRAVDPGRPDAEREPSYVFRCADTGVGSCLGLMAGPGDVEWYGRVGAVAGSRLGCCRRPQMRPTELASSSSALG